MSKRLAIVIGVAAAGVMAFGAQTAAAGKLTADYRFEGNLKSNGVDAPNLTEYSSGGTFGQAMIGGSNNGVWDFPAGDGLRLDKGTKVMGSKGKTYTFVMLVSLSATTGYRKLVDFDDLNSDEGWYVYEHSLYPYNLPGADYDKQMIEDDSYEQITLTRTEDGVVRGYVGDKKIDGAKDKDKDIALGADKILHFLMDDGGVEESAASIARLRIWDTALSAERIKHLGK